MHEARCPAAGMAVMVRVKKIAGTGGVPAPLLEYNSTEGIILLSEPSPQQDPECLQPHQGGPASRPREGVHRPQQAQSRSPRRTYRPAGSASARASSSTPSCVTPP